MRIYDPALAPADPVYYWDYAYTDAWRWGVVNPLSDEPATKLDDAPAFGRVDRYTVNGATWTFEYVDANDTSQLKTLHAAGLTAGSAFTGFVDGIVALDGRP